MAMKSLDTMPQYEKPGDAQIGKGMLQTVPGL